MYNDLPHYTMAYLLEKIKKYTGGSSQEASVHTRMPNENKEILQEPTVSDENKKHEEMLKELSRKTKQNTVHMTLENNVYYAKIVHIYDGDSMHVVFKEFDNFYRWTCRIMGVDTPELRTRNENEKALGYKVRDILREKLLNKIVKIKCEKFDKYGRLLIDVYIPNEMKRENAKTGMLSEWLIDNQYAYEYDGGTKQNWDVISLAE